MAGDKEYEVNCVSVGNPHCVVLDDQPSVKAAFQAGELNRDVVVVVRFQGDLAVLYRSLLWLRTAIRVLAHLARGPAAHRDGLYALTARVPWEEVLTPDRTFAVEAVGRSRALRHTGFAAQVVKDAAQRDMARIELKPAIPIDVALR